MELEECPICLECLNIENDYLITKCNHHFHSTCIFKYLLENDNKNKCPYCNQMLYSSEKVDIKCDNTLVMVFVISYCMIISLISLIVIETYK